MCLPTHRRLLCMTVRLALIINAHSPHPAGLTRELLLLAQHCSRFRGWLRPLRTAFARCASSRVRSTLLLKLFQRQFDSTAQIAIVEDGSTLPNSSINHSHLTHKSFSEPLFAKKDPRPYRPRKRKRYALCSVIFVLILVNFGLPVLFPSNFKGFFFTNEG